MENCKEEYATLIDAIHKKLKVLLLYVEVQEDIIHSLPEEIDNKSWNKAAEIYLVLKSIVAHQGFDEELIMSEVSE